MNTRNGDGVLGALWKVAFAADSLAGVACLAGRRSLSVHQQIVLTCCPWLALSCWRVDRDFCLNPLRLLRNLQRRGKNPGECTLFSQCLLLSRPPSFTIQYH